MSEAAQEPPLATRLVEEYGFPADLVARAVDAVGATADLGTAVDTAGEWRVDMLQARDDSVEVSTL